MTKTIQVWLTEQDQTALLACRREMRIAERLGNFSLADHASELMMALLRGQITGGEVTRELEGEE